MLLCVASHKVSPVVIDLTGYDDESDWDIDWDIELEISSLQPHDSGQAIQRVESTIELSASEETKLLHSAQEASGSQVAASGDQVAKLLGTIAALRTQLAMLATPKVDSGDAPTLLRIVGERLGLGCGDFTLFPKLPIELRSMIWQFAHWSPRSTDFCTDYVCGSSDVVFVRPSKTPGEILSKNQIKTMFKIWKLPETPDLTWQFAEEQDAKMLRSLKPKYIRLRNETIKDGINPVRFQHALWVGNPSKWTWKKISYMQAVSASVARAAAGM
ncbi:uncharacterized protein RSE6_03203 [Rhynchosporium secalis]|uniref:2EXR domain-containing protein n=1 Tax=Rhynchosporium secalis TaxID=38038 RepID=A0A1E1M269_RHYSE|nr:uncharacterized protein RSE6_03203 [Rhynchosporium secalis]